MELRCVRVFFAGGVLRQQCAYDFGLASQRWISGTLGAGMSWGRAPTLPSPRSRLRDGKIHRTIGAKA